MKKIWVISLSILMLSACASTQNQNEDVDSAVCPVPVERKAVFDQKQYDPYDGKGQARINGRLCITGMDGRKKCPAEQIVVVNPVTDYSTEWYQRSWVNNEFLAQPDERAEKYTRIVKTDKNGWFTITGLPAGEYYVGVVVCPCDGFDEKERSNYRFQRYGTKVSVKKSVKANLEKVFE